MITPIRFRTFLALLLLLSLGIIPAARAQFAFDSPTGTTGSGGRTTFTVYPGDTLTFHGTLTNNYGTPLDNVAILPTFTGGAASNFTFIYPQRLYLDYNYVFDIYDTNSNNTLMITAKSSATPGTYVFYFDADAQGDDNGNFTGDIYSDYYNLVVAAASSTPTLTGFSPASGAVGTSVILTGTGFTGATAVTFGGTAAANYSVDSDAQITVPVPAGAATGPIVVTTPGGTATSSTSFTVTPPAALSSLSANPTTVTAGSPSSIFAALTTKATSDVIISLTSSNSAALSVPASVVIHASYGSKTFSATSYAVTATTTVTVTATYNGVSKTATVTVNPAPAALSSISASPTSVVGGTANPTGVVGLTAKATTPVTITLTSSAPSALSVPSSVTINPTYTTVHFTARSLGVGAATTVTITATLNGVSKTTQVTVTPVPPSLSSVSASPASVQGGTANATGVVGLTGKATGTTTISLTSSAPSALSVPSSVVIGTGYTTVHFTATSYAVTASTPVTITATYNGVSQTTTVTVTP